MKPLTGPHPVKAHAMIRRQHTRPLALLLLVIQIWMAGAAAACHNHLHLATPQRASSLSALAPVRGAAIAASRSDAAAPCPACSYLKAVRGAVLVPPIGRPLPAACIPTAQSTVVFISCRPQLRLAGRSPPTL